MGKVNCPLASPLVGEEIEFLSGIVCFVMNSLKKNIISNVSWNVFNGFSSQLIQFIVILVIARLITPSEFGLIAMLTIFISIGQVLIDGGLSTALIQKIDRTDTDKSTAFYFNLFVSILLYVLLFLLSPLVADFYNEHILVKLSRVLGINFIISAFSLVQRTEFIINNDFKSITKCSIIAILISGFLGVGAALCKLGVWALVVQTLSFNIIQTFLFKYFSTWKPQKGFSVDSFKALFPFASKLIFSSILNVIYTNSYTLVIGKFFKASDVGIYTRANMFAQFPSTYLANFVSKALFPIQCSLQNDHSQLTALIYKYIRTLSLIIIPSMVLLSVLSKPIICFFLTEKWIAASSILSLLSVAYILIPIMSLNEILNVLGRSDLFLKSEIVKKIIGVSILLLSVPFGVKAMCVGLILYGIIDSIVIVYFLKKIINLSFVKSYLSIVQPLISSFISGIVIATLNSSFDNYFVQLCLCFLLFLVSYFICLMTFRNKELLVIVEFIKTKYNEMR